MMLCFIGASLCRVTSGYSNCYGGTFEVLAASWVSCTRFPHPYMHLYLAPFIMSCTYDTERAHTLMIRLTHFHAFPNRVCATANLRTKIVHFRGFDSSIILKLRGGILMPIGKFPEMLSQPLLVGIILVERLGVFQENHTTFVTLCITMQSLGKCLCSYATTSGAHCSCYMRYCKQTV